MTGRHMIVGVLCTLVAAGTWAAGLWAHDAGCGWSGIAARALTAFAALVAGAALVAAGAWGEP